MFRAAALPLPTPPTATSTGAAVDDDDDGGWWAADGDAERYSEPAGKLVELLLCARLSIEPDRLPSSSGYGSREASASANGLGNGIRTMRTGGQSEWAQWVFT